MFLNFYGLREQPFGVTPDPEFLYLGATHREALASVTYGIQAGVGFAAVIAKPGMGKTTLLFALLRHFRNSAQSAFLFDTQCNSKELLQNLLAEFKLQPESGSGDASALNCLRQFLLRSARANQRVLLVVDEAQNLDIPVFETLRLLSNFETPHAKLLHIVLAGQPELGRKLALPELEQLRQRITIVSRLDAFSSPDVIRYVVHRLKRAGYRGGPLFTPEALGLLVDMSHGVPREINRLCFNAMSLGCALGKKLIDGQIVREAVADLEFGPVLKREESAQGQETTQTTDALAELFTDALAVAAPLKEEKEKEEAASVTREPAPEPAEIATPVALESEQQPLTAAEPVRVHPKAELEEQAVSVAKSSIISVWLSYLLSAAVAFRKASRNACGQAAQKMLNLRTKGAAVARQLLGFGVRGLAYTRSRTAMMVNIFRSLIRAATAFQARLRTACGQIAQKKPNLSAKPAAVVAHSRPLQGFEFRRLAWAGGLLAAAALVFGGLIWSGNVHRATVRIAQTASEKQKSVGQWFTSLKPASASASRVVSTTQKVISTTEKSVGQWLTSLKPVSASEEEKDRPKLNSGGQSVHAASSPASPPIKLALDSRPTNSVPANKDLSAQGATASTTGRKHRDMQTAEPPRRTALTASKIPGTHYSVAFAQAPAAKHFIASGLGASAVNDAAATGVNEAAKPVAPETTLAAKLIKRVDPVYPLLARNSGISGGVVLNAHIDEAGKVQDVRAISGNPGLVDAAVEAVRQWQYQPPFVNGQPRQSDARIVINFSLR